MKLKANIGDTDRSFRFFVGGAILFYAILTQSLFGILGAVGVAVLATAYLRSCPAYLPLDINTNR